MSTSATITRGTALVNFRPRRFTPNGAAAGAVPKSFDPFTLIAAAASGVAGAVGDIINTPSNNATAEELAEQATEQARINAESSAAANAALVTGVKYVVGATLLGFILYLIFK